MSISLNDVKSLREKTGASIMVCKKAMEEADGDQKKAMEFIEKRGVEKAMKRSERETKQGIIEAYIHNNGKVGVILELNCETDFVARNEEFKALAHDIAMHVAALEPKDEKELLVQPFIKDESKTIKDLLAEAVAKIGENIQVGGFHRLGI